MADVIVGRELCLYLAVDASQVPPKQRAGYVAIAVRRSAPFSDPAWDVSWQGGHASVWYWSRERLSASLAALSASRLRCFAESRFVGTRRDDGLEVLQFADGYVARIWKQGWLIADRWWQDEPDRTAWSRFLRGAGLASDVDIPRTAIGPIQPTAWDSTRSEPMTGALGRLSFRDWLSISLLALCLVVGAMSGAMARNAIELLRLRGDVELLTESSGHILAARSEAEASLEKIEALLALRPAARPTRLAASLSKVLEGQDWTIRSFALDGSGQMAATLHLASVDPAALVRSLEATGDFTDASVEIIPNSSQVVLRARVRSNTGAPLPSGEGT